MGESKHTPGPWEYVPSTEHHGPYVTTGADMTYGDIADCYVMSKPAEWSTRNGGDSKPIPHQHERADANARLIAAAPDLLEAATAALGMLTGNLDGDWDSDVDPVVMLRAAISKATGEQG